MVGTDYALKLYKRVYYQDLDLREPQLSDYYKRSVQQKQGEMIYVVAGTSTLGLAVSFFFFVNWFKMERKALKSLL